MTRPTALDTTDRGRAKADRHAALLREAARLFAERGFAAVSLEELGAAVGITGPAVYRHFASKQALLAAVLLSVSERLLDGGRAVVAGASSPRDQLDGLVAFHTDFALADADVIRVHDRESAALREDDRRRVRRLQREYVEVWVGVLSDVHPRVADGELRLRAQACFGLLNSTPYSVRADPGGSRDGVRHVLAAMATAALTA